MSPADIELAKILTTAGIELVKVATEWFATGKRPPPERVEKAWASIEQAKAKIITDAAADARWSRGEG